MEQTTTLGDALTRLWDEAGNPSFRSIERDLLITLGDLAPTDETIRQMHHGKREADRLSPHWMLAMAKYYGAEPADLGPDAERRINSLLELVSMDSDAFRRCFTREPVVQMALDFDIIDLRESTPHLAWAA
jgi:hypothetical protein